MADKELFLGETVADGERTGDGVFYDPSDLTTHGVIVGMTGSGKTGLGVVLLEEALRNGIPTLVLDPKGDMTNLALRFPGLSADEFAPWVPDGGDAAGTADVWKNGLAGWGLDGSHLQSLADGAPVTVYTPGSTSGVPLNIIGSLNAPTSGDTESMRDEIEGLVSGLLSMVGVDADPLASREHILLSNLVERAWSAGTDLDLGVLVQQVQQPPMRKLGVLELDSFFPEADRTKLALKLNGLLASPSFAAWAEGVPLDIGQLLSTDEGTSCSVIYLAHLSDEERQFVVTLLLSKVITWMRAQSGTPDLRALVYMDEVFGFVPPTAAPPAKKPILTILKQARAFGVGMVLSTQNPVDLDYKAISNAGTWMIGRLQTERDVGRLSDGLSAASGDVDLAALQATIAGLGKREFVLHTTKGAQPSTFTTRWALDYLAGPLTRDQLGELPGQPGEQTVAAAATSAATATTPVAERAVEVGDDQVTVPPTVADGVEVRYADVAAPWLADVGGDPDGTTLRAAVAVRVEMLFDETKADLRHTETFECIAVGPDERLDADEATIVDYDDRDLSERVPTNPVYELPAAKLDTKVFWSDAEKAVKERLYRDRTLTLFKNGTLKLWSRPGESRDDFVARCHVAAEDMEDKDAEKLRTRMESKMATIQRAIDTAEERAEKYHDQAGDKKQHELLSGAGDLLGSLLGGRNKTKSILGKVKGISSRRSATNRATQQAEAAQEKAAAKEVELMELEQDLADELFEIDAKWMQIAEEIEEVEVGLEKNDISVVQLALVWVPVS